MRIYYVIEIKKRELLARVIFATYAASKGWSAVIGSKESILSKSNLLEPGYYMMKSIQHGTINIVKDLKQKGFRLISADEEGLMHYNDEYYLRRFSKKVLEEMYKFFTWGKKDKNLLDLNFPEHKDKIKVAGNTRVNLLDSRFDSFFDEEVENIKKKYGSFFLISTKFGKINFVKRKGYNEYVENQIKAGYVKTQSAKKTAINAKKHEEINFQEYLKLIEIFGKKINNLNLIVLPHPGEDLKIYKSIVDKFDNVHLVTNEFSTISLLKACEANIACNCTTSVETFLVGNLSINYQPYEDKKVEYTLPFLTSKNIRNSDLLIEYLLSINENKKDEIKKIYELNIEQIKENIDMDFFVEKVLQNLEKFDVAHKDLNNGFLFRIYYKFKRFFKNFIYITLRLDKRAKLKKQKIPNLNKTEIENILKKASKVLNIKNVNVEEIYPGIFEFKNSDKI